MIGERNALCEKNNHESFISIIEHGITRLLTLSESGTAVSDSNQREKQRIANNMFHA